MSAPPSDQAHTNLAVSHVLSVPGRLVAANSVMGTASIENLIIKDGSEGDVLTNIEGVGRWSNSLITSTLNNGLQFDNIQQQVGRDQHHSFVLSNLYTQLASGMPPPVIPAGRTITINNGTAATTLDIYVTEGYPTAKAATIIPGGTAVAPGGSVIWAIPVVSGWNGNFTAFPTGSPWTSGASLAEFGLNQLWSGAVPPLRDTVDISNVPPGIGTQCNDGPHGFPPPFPPDLPGDNPNCVYFSLTSGFSAQQSKGYNIGMQIIPPVSIILPPAQTVTAISPDGNSPESIGYPNDTAVPKQQTIDCLAVGGDYVLNLLDPVFPLP